MMVLGPAAGAHATGTVSTGDTAVLVSKGAGVLVPVEVTCGEGSASVLGSSVTVLLHQRSGNRIADGVGSASVVCDGTTHVVDALVIADDVPFKPGTALVTTSAFVCDLSGCRSTTQSAEIRIRN
jgi:hypothetical protein